MANSAAGGASDYNTEIITEFRANQGYVGGMWAGTTLILIHHIGAKSGIERVTPVACSPQGGGRFAIWAANGGSPAHPNWYYNLKAHPRITVEMGPRRSRFWRRNWAAPPAPSCGQSWSRSGRSRSRGPRTSEQPRPRPRGSFLCSC
jgi:deazaflavin-dependent oxidoreductase (nitroreductase family)